MASIHPEETASEFPRAWKWAEDGNELTGTYGGMDSGQTSYGPAGIILLDRPDGERVAVWLLSMALKSKFAEELERRAGAEDFDPGERITIVRGSEKESATGRTYRAFKVSFHDAPRPDARTILGIGGAATADPELPPDEPSAQPDAEDVPF